MIKTVCKWKEKEKKEKDEIQQKNEIKKKINEKKKILVDFRKHYQKKKQKKNIVKHNT